MDTTQGNSSNFKLYGLIVGLTVTIMITCDTLVYKSIDIASFKITASGVIFSLCFLLSTISTEVYGYKLGGRTVWIIVICQTFFVLLINISAVIQVENNEISRQYYALFNEFWRVMLGTWISVPVAYFCNGFIISKLKMFFHGKWFIIRYAFSAFTAQGLLLLTAYPISLWNKYGTDDLINIILTTWTYKVAVSILLLPLGVYLVGVVKRIEKTDYYDWDISYNPLKIFRDNSVGVNRNAYK